MWRKKWKSTLFQSEPISFSFQYCQYERDIVSKNVVLNVSKYFSFRSQKSWFSTKKRTFFLVKVLLVSFVYLHTTVCGMFSGGFRNCIPIGRWRPCRNCAPWCTRYQPPETYRVLWPCILLLSWKSKWLSMGEGNALFWFNGYSFLNTNPTFRAIQI